MSDDSKGTRKNPGYELSDAAFRPILFAGLALFFLMMVAFIFIFGLFGFFREAQEESMVPASPLAVERQLPPQPRLQVKPDLDWDVFNAQQDSLLDSYGWVVKEAGVVRVPIAEAVEMMLERGFHVRTEYGKEEMQNRRSRIEDGGWQR